ncbi:MAG: aminotransferase class V-fold PLP-dependent enzyme [Acidobacteria bacterium]|nr:aminotransferase class V-fold PLP-dependent enzyme [Acidobacteriota bacterium]
MDLSRRQFLGAASSALTLSRVAPPAAVAGTGDDPLGVRADFPVTREGIYLNSAYIAPIPAPVVEAGRAFLEAKSSHPLSVEDMQAKTDTVRRQFASLIGATSDEIGFLFATSEGENVVARALDLKAGDNVVIDELHYLTTFVLYKHLEQTAGIELRIAKHRDGRVHPKDFEPLVDGKTRLVSVAWVSHQNGFRHDLRPLADLAHARGAFLYTDAMQAVGMFPIDVRAAGVDFLTTGTYKWLLAGFGVAPFFVRRELIDRIRPDRMGHFHVEKELAGYRYQLYRSAKKYEYAVLAEGAVYQLGAALAYLERLGVDKIETHTVGLAQQLREGLAERGLRMFTPPENRSSIVTFFVDRNPEAARSIFDEAKIHVSFKEKGAQIRVAPAVFNSAWEIERLLEVAEKLT